jgi:hypothetical protein
LTIYLQGGTPSVDGRGFMVAVYPTPEAATAAFEEMTAAAEKCIP